MAHFHYRVSDESGKISEGKAFAGSREELLQRLHEKKLHAIEIESEDRDRAVSLEETIYRRIPISKQSIAFIFDQLSLMLESGVSLVDALQSQEEQSNDFRVQEVLSAVRAKVEEGIPLYVALQEKKGVFDETSIRIVEAGEQSGQLGVALASLARMIEFDLKIRRRFNEATRYPKIVIGVLFLAVTILSYMVIPKFAQMFQNANVDLPIFTKAIILFYTSIESYWPIALFLVLLVLVFLAFVRKNPNVMGRYERLKLKTPLIGGLQLKLEISRIFRILAILLDNGVDILNAIQLVSKIARNKVFSSALDDMRLRLEGGQSMKSALEAIPFLPKMARRMILLGDKSGRLSHNLISLSDIYEKQTRSTISSIGGMIEPILIVTIGLIVLFFALGIFLPMWDVVKVVK